ncbi:hypothetical protein CTAYLR_002135, partial [Chrysophaeum taylorii]
MPLVAEPKSSEDDVTYLVRKIRKVLRTEAKSESLRSLFRELDRNGDGSITALEFRKGLRDLGFRLDEFEVTELVRHCDLNGNGCVSFREFEDFVNCRTMRDRDARGGVQEVLDRLGEIVEKKYSWRGMQEAFEEFDADFSGEIDAEEMHEGLRKFGITLSVAEAERVLARFPGDGRRVRYRDFVAAMSGRPPPFYAGARTATYAIRRLAQEVERCSRTKTGYDVRKVFEDLDEDGSGSLDRREIRVALERIGVSLTRSELMGVMDFFGGNPIDVATFTQFALREDPGTKQLLNLVRRELDRLSERNRGPPDYRGAFRELDADASGTIDHFEFKTAMRNLGLRLSSAQVRQIMCMFDANGDNRISCR